MKISISFLRFLRIKGTEIRAQYCNLIINISLIVLLLTPKVNLYAQIDINDIAQQNARAIQKSIIADGNQGILAGISFEKGLVSMPLSSMDKINGNFLAIHTVGIIANNNNACITTGIGVQRRKILSRYFWDPGIYLKADINLFQRILYITPGIECILNSPFNVDWALDDFIQNYGSIKDIDVVPQIGIGCHLGFTRFELVYKQGLFPFTDGNYPNGNALQLGKSTYVAFRFSIIWI
jgi:hypothetical protein